MASLARSLVVAPDGRLVIPRRMAELLGMHPGGRVAVESREGEVVLRPEEDRDPDQAWFWTPEWQEGVAHAEQELAEGKSLGRFSNPADLIAALHAGCPDADD